MSIGLPCTTAYLRDQINNLVLRNVAWTPPQICYAALFSDDPGETGSPNNEIFGGDYIRVPIYWFAPASNVFANQGIPYLVNQVDVSWPVALNGWLTATYLGICDAASGGHVLFRTQLPYPITPQLNQQFRILARAMRLTLD